jgi:glutathione S-transferase
MSMKLYYAPGACSMGIHVLLEEIGKPYELQKIALREGEHLKPPFTEINPKAKVPTLERDDGSILTEFPAIALWLARTNPEAKLWPDDADSQARALEAMDYAVATVHMRGFSRMFRPSAYTPNPADEEKVKARGREMFEQGLAILDKALDGREYVTGGYSIADAALFYVEYWASNFKVPLPPNCAAHFARMQARPAVQRMMQQEGLVRDGKPTGVVS